MREEYVQELRDKYRTKVSGITWATAEFCVLLLAKLKYMEEYKDSSPVLDCTNISKFIIPDDGKLVFRNVTIINTEEFFKHTLTRELYEVEDKDLRVLMGFIEQTKNIIKERK